MRRFAVCGMLIAGCLLLAGSADAVQPAMSIRELASANPVKAVLALSNPQPRVGEEVQVHIDLMLPRAQVTVSGKSYPHYPVRNVQFTLPAFDASPCVRLPQPLEQLIAARGPQPGQRGYKVNNLPGEVMLDREPANPGTERLDPANYRRRLSLPLRVEQAGRVKLQPVRITGEVLIPQPAPGKWQNFTVSSGLLTFDVREGPVAAAETPRAASRAAGERRRPLSRESALEESEPDAPGFALSSSQWLLLGGSVTGLLVVGLVGWLAVRGWMRRGTRATRLEAERGPAESRRRLQRSGLSVLQVKEAVHDFLRGRFQLPSGEITPADAAEQLRQQGVEEASVRACADWLEACAAAEFAPGPGSSAAELAAAALQMIDQVDRIRPSTVGNRQPLSPVLGGVDSPGR